MRDGSTLERKSSSLQRTKKLLSPPPSLRFSNQPCSPMQPSKYHLPSYVTDRMRLQSNIPEEDYPIEQKTTFKLFQHLKLNSPKRTNPDEPLEIPESTRRSQLLDSPQHLILTNLPESIALIPKAKPSMKLSLTEKHPLKGRMIPIGCFTPRLKISPSICKNIQMQ